MATPNYGYEKRQRELAKKKKKEEKARAKAAGKPLTDDGGGINQDQSNDAPTSSDAAEPPEADKPV